MGKPECSVEASIQQAATSSSSSGRVCEDRNELGRVAWAEVKVVGTADIIAGFGPINLLLGPAPRKGRLASAGSGACLSACAQGCQLPGQRCNGEKGRRAESGRLSPRLGSLHTVGGLLLSAGLALHVQRSGIRWSVVLCGVGGGRGGFV